MSCQRALTRAFPLVLVALLAPVVGAATLEVPGVFPTIGAAMAAAQPGDTVLVADGVYTGADNKWLSFDGKGFTVRSENGPAGCVIDCENAGLAFFFVVNEPPTALVEGFTIRNGNNPTGGAVWIHHDSDPTFRDCVFTGNTASSGGAVFMENGSRPTFDACTFEGNTAITGGAFYIWDVSVPKIVGCNVSGNSATAQGGGFYINTFATVPTIESSIVRGNTAGGDGGGFYVRIGAPAIRSCTVTANTAGGVGGALAVQGPADVEVRDSILWQDAAAAGAEIALLDDPSFGGASASVAFSDVEGGQAAVQVDPGSGLLWGAGNIDLDPLFVDAPAGDVRITGDSPAVDAGDPAAVLDPAHPYDVLGFGHPRLDDGDFDDVEVVDMGATEFGGLLGTTLAAVGQTVEMDLWGRPGAQYLLFASLPGALPVDLGALGSGFLEPALLTQLASGVLPAAGQATVLSAPAPGFVAGLTIGFQAVTSGPAGQGPHLSNLETVAVTP